MTLENGRVGSAPGRAEFKFGNEAKRYRFRSLQGVHYRVSMSLGRHRKLLGLGLRMSLRSVVFSVGNGAELGCLDRGWISLFFLLLWRDLMNL